MTRQSKHSNQAASRRPTIALLVARIGRVWNREFMAGVTDAAQAADVNLLCFVGRQPRYDDSRDFSLYNLVTPAHLDGLILSADLGYGVSRDVMQRFCQGFSPLPIVALSLEVENIPVISFDSSDGMRQAVTHLVEAHGRRRIAFIRGPAGQFEAEQRCRAYTEALQSLSLVTDPQLVLPGDSSPESGRVAVRTLLDERKVSFDAIVAANDRAAFGALEVLQERGLQVPSDLSLVGFDDVMEAQVLGVPLTTVRQPFYLSGQRAVAALLNLLRGERLPEQELLPTELVIRWSCGCLPPTIRQVASAALDIRGKSAKSRAMALDKRRSATIKAILDTLEPYALPGAALSRARTSAVLEQIWQAFLNDLRDPAQDTFPKTFAQALTAAQQLPVERDASLWHSLLSEFRRQVLPYLLDNQSILRAENMLEQARILIGEAAQRAQAYQRLAVEQQEARLQGIGSTLATMVSMRDIANAAQLHFSGLDIQRCHIALYELPEYHPQSVDPRSLRARLFLKYAQGEVELISGNAYFPACDLAPQELFPSERRYTAIITSLGLAQNPVGFMWNEVGPSDWEVYTRLSNLLSSAIFRALLIRQREEAMQEVGKLLISAEEYAIELARAKEVAEGAAHRTQRALEETDGLFRAARAILGATDVASICQKLTSQFTSLVQAEHVLIFIVDHEHRLIALAVNNGQLVDDPGVTYRELISGLCGDVFMSRQPLLSLDVDDFADLPSGAWEGQIETLGSVIVVPLATKERITGVVLALNEADRHPFTQHDMDLLTSLATQAAAAIESARMYQAEQERRQVAEMLVQAGRKLTSTLKLREVPGHILEQLSLVVPYERASLILQEGNSLRIVAQRGFPADERLKQLQILIREGDVFQQVVSAGRPLVIEDVTQTHGWQQVEWLPLNRSWMGVPLFSQNRVIGMLSLTRPDVAAFTQDDSILVSTFALQAAIALENAGLYDEITRFNEQLEQMVAQRTEELNHAYHALEKLDQNKTDFINVAAHELRTPLTVIKGYMGMVGSDTAVSQSAYLSEIVKVVLKGTDRLHVIINSMLDVARIDSQILDLHIEPTSLAVALKRIQSDYATACRERQITITLENIDRIPIVHADPGLLLKVFQNLITNAIKYTPDGGRITVSGVPLTDEQIGECVEVLVQDTGIGIDPEHHELIFEKFYQTGTVALHSSGESKFKGGGPGLGLAIVRGIVQAHGGRIWVESEGQDEERCPGSTFHVRLPLVASQKS